MTFNENILYIINAQLKDDKVAYDENNINAIKGRIGELIYFYELKDKNNVNLYQSADMQKYGVDWCLKFDNSPYEIFVDVKLSDHLDTFFTLFYKNEKNIRHPFKKGCLSDWLSIVSFDWKRAVKDSGKSEMEFAEEAKMNLEKSSDAYLINLKKYTKSIISVKTNTILGLCSDFYSKNNNESNTNNKGEITSTKKEYGKYIIAEIYWSAIGNESKIVHFQNENWSDISKVSAEKYKWPFKKSSLINIDEFGKDFSEMKKESLLWILEELENDKSTFHKKFNLSKSDFKQVIENNL